MELEHSQSNVTGTQTIQIIRQRLGHLGFIGRHKARAQDFTRQRSLPFARVITLLLQKTARSLQLHLNDFFDRLDRGFTTATASAWCQARLKLRHTAFIELNEQAILEPVYGAESRFAVRRWHGHRLLAIDSSLLYLPNEQALGEEFGWVDCRNQKGECGRYVQGRLSVLTDVLNRLALETLLVSSAVGERALAMEHVNRLGAEDVALMDRGFAGYELWARLLASGRHFVCRCGRGSFGIVGRLMVENQPGRSLTMRLRPSHGAVGPMRQKGLPETITVRFVTLRLNTGELEVLASSLLDEQKHPTQSFGEVYGYRWGVETYYGLLKGRLDLENFSGQSVEAVRQDVYACVLLSNLETILTAPTQTEMAQRAAVEATPAKQVNHAVGFHTIKSHLIDLLLSREPVEEVIEKMRGLFGGNPVVKRPGRKSPRRKTSAWRSYRFQRYIRKVVF